jgi:hypothetical protein
MFKPIRIVLITLLAALTLVACGQTDEQKKAAAKAAKEAAAANAPPVAQPTDPKDTVAWKAYFKDVVTRNMDGVQTRTPYLYWVPAGDDDETKSARVNQLDNVKVVVARGVVAGNMMAFGGPDSVPTADLIVAAFAGARAGSMKNVRLLFIGKADDGERVKAAVTATGVDFRLVELK